MSTQDAILRELARIDERFVFLVQHATELLGSLSTGDLSSENRLLLTEFLRPEYSTIANATFNAFPAVRILYEAYASSIERDNDDRDDPDDAPLVDDYMKAFGKGFKSALGFLTTQERLRKEFNKHIRPNELPDPILPWEMRIGASKFYVPPININVTQTFRTGSLTGGTLRQQNTPKFNTGHSETMINMTLYFPNHQSIWGIENNREYINFDVADKRVIDRFLSSLRGLITQFKYAPFLPVQNQYLNQAYGITGVVMHSMTVSTLENYPFCLAVNLQLLKFNHKVYLPMVEHFAQAIHWGKYRQYMGRAAQRMVSAVSEGFLMEEPGDSRRVIERPEDIDRNNPAPIISYENRPTVIFDRKREWQQGKNLDIYYPARTPLRVFAPDLSSFRSPGEDESTERTKQLWEKLLGLINIDVDTNPTAIYDNILNYSTSISASDYRNERLILFDFLNSTNAAVETLTSEELEKFKQRRYDDYTSSGRELTQAARDEIDNSAEATWFLYIFENWRNSPFFQSILNDAEFRDGHLLVKEWDVPMEKMQLNWKNVIIDGVSVSLSNNVARLQVQLQDEPVHQHIGGGDSRVDVALTIFGEDELSRIRRVFEHINGLARLEHAHGVLGFLGIRNVITGLCGVKYALPISFEVDSVPGYPHVYKVRLSFIDFDIFQQKRESLSSEQQREIIDAFGKRNPFLRVKQLWGSFSAYPDFPLSVKDEFNKVVGHLDPDYYFKAYQMIDDDIVHWDAPQGGGRNRPRRPRSAAEILRDIAERQGGAIRPGDPERARKLAAREALDHARSEEARNSDAEGGAFDYKSTGYAIDYSGVKTYESLTKNYEHSVTHHFGVFGKTEGRSQLVKLGKGGTIGVGSQNIEGGPPEMTAQDMVLNDDTADQTLVTPSLPDFTPFAEYGSPYADGEANPNKQFELMMLDAQYRNLSGRMVRAFPTYMLWLIDEGGNFAGVKLFDDFYGLQSIIDFSLVESEDILGDTLILRVSNLYSKLTTDFKNGLGIDRTDPNTRPEEHLIGILADRATNLIRGTTNQVFELEHVRLKPGVRLHLRAGYSANPNSMPTIFNGTVTNVEAGDIVTITAQSDAIELGPMINTTNKKGHSGKIDGAMNTGLWLSEPRDLMVRLLSMGASTFKESIAHATQGMIFSENRFGIRHFGSILYEPLSEDEEKKHQDRYDAVKATLDQMTGADNPGDSLTAGDAATAAAEFTGADDAFAAATYNPLLGTQVVRTPMVNVMQSMWANFFRKRDYELFKRNIYPGNGLGVAQYLGGDMIDGGLAAASVGHLASQIPLNESEPAARIRESGGDQTLLDDLQQEQAESSAINDLEAGLFETLATPLIGPFAGVLKDKSGPVLQMLGLTGRDDDVEGYDEISFRAQTYMKSVWDLFQLCAALLPNYIVAVRPFEDRSTVFYGKPHWLYTSGVIPISQGVGKDDGPKIEDVDKELQDLLRQAAEAANPLGDLEEQLAFYEDLRSASPLTTPAGLTGEEWGGDFSEIESLPLERNGVQIIPVRHGSSVEEMHLPTSDNLDTDRSQHIQDPGLAADKQHPYYMDRVGGVRGGEGTGSGSTDVSTGTRLGEDPNLPGKGGAFGILDPSSEQYYMNMRWPTNNGYPGPWRGKKILVFNKGTNRACICTPGDWGPAESTGHIAGISPDTALALGGAGGDFWFGLVGDNINLGPIASLNANNDDRANPPGSPTPDERVRDFTGDPFNLDTVDDWYDEDSGYNSPRLYEWNWGYRTREIPVYIDPESNVYADLPSNTGYMARLLYDKEFLEREKAAHPGEAKVQGASIISGGGRTLEQAEGIWDQFRRCFGTYSEVKDAYEVARASEGGQKGTEFDEDDYVRTINKFRRFMWQDPYNRAWLVITADRHIDNNPGSDWDQIPGLGGGACEGGEWNFSHVQELWKMFIDPSRAGEIDLHEDAATGRLVSQTLFAWMVAHQEAGSDASNALEGAIDAIQGLYDATIGKLWTAASQALSGIASLYRLSMMQLGQGLSMVGSMQKQANVLNKVFNDSIYYAVGRPGSLLRLADNPFTREYGEPVVEIREPFQRMHYVDSFQHILSNNIQENLSGVPTVVTATSDGKYPVTVHFDKGLSAERQTETTVETGLFWDNAKGSGFFGMLHPLLHPIETLRGITKITTGSNDELMSKRVGLWHLKEGLKDIYMGELIILGDPDIRPHDLVYLADVYERMYGMFEVEQVIHHFTPENGFITTITPNAIVTVNDPARWSMISWVWSWWSVKNARDDTRSLMNIQANESSLVFRDDGVTPQDLAESLQTQMRGHVQYTHGGSALVKDLASSASLGLIDAGQAAQNRNPIGTAGALGLAALGSMPIVGDVVWEGWEWVRDNLLDQHGCYIQYLNKDGQPMDAGIAYNQGVAVGRHHSINLLPGILGMDVDIRNQEGHRRITSNDLLKALGWKEVEISGLVRDISWWVSQTNAQVLQLAGASPDEVTFNKPNVEVVEVVRVLDGDTIEIDDGRSIRFAGIAAPELLFKDDPATDLDEVQLNAIRNQGRLAQEYVQKRLIDDAEAGGYDPTVAIRINNQNKTDKYGRTLAVVFHNVPQGTPVDERNRILEEIAGRWPIVEWDSYMDDSRPYTMNWELAMVGLAVTDMGGLVFNSAERGAIIGGSPDQGQGDF